ncbi:unnamed protein product [Oikopleura dioica]|uniref:Uncharacterized protein n=1 Tax=Oikopleura dioica TaxID=34765 RepID=E4YE68_OIKDI|nr:unnamed protein product [Oikopleura dioica]
MMNKRQICNCNAFYEGEACDSIWKFIICLTVFSIGFWGIIATMCTVVGAEDPLSAKNNLLETEFSDDKETSSNLWKADFIRKSI